MLGNLFKIVSSEQQLSALLTVCSQLQLVSSVFRHGAIYVRAKCICIWHLLEYGSARKCRRKFRRKFLDERIPSRQSIHSLANELRSTGLLIYKKEKHKRLVLTEEKLDDVGVRLQHTPRKSLKRLAQETGVSKSGARGEHNCWNLDPVKQQKSTPCFRARSSWQNYFLQFCTVCHRRWDRYAVDIHFWWRVVSHAGIHKYAKWSLMEFTESTSNPRSPASSREICSLVCCKCKKDCCTCVL
jgi:hypothetical protein